MTFSNLTLAGALATGTLLSACGASDDEVAVRYGPQAVHPSGSKLSQGVGINDARVAAVIVVLAPANNCGGAGQPACYVSSPNDGSHPIIH